MASFRAWVGAHRGLAAGIAAAATAVVVAAAVTVAVVGGGSSTNGASSDDSSTVAPAANGSSNASTSMTDVPTGSFGTTAGTNVELAPGLRAIRFSAPNGGRGRISIDGPARIVLEGSYVYTDASNWVVTIDNPTGSVAGVQLQPGEASGRIESKAGTVSSDVTVGVSAQPHMVEDWDQSSLVKVAYAPGTSTTQGLVGDVRVATSRGQNALSGVARLGEDDRYSMSIDGSIVFATSTVYLRGSYEGVAGRNGSDHSWSISGSTASGQLRESTVHDIAIDMTQDDPSVTGSTTVDIGGLFPINVATGLRFIDTSNWTLTAFSSDTAQFTHSGPDVVANTSKLHGEISSFYGIEVWDLRSPMETRDEDLTLIGELVIGGPYRFDLEAHDARGTILGSDVKVSYRRAAGVVAFDRGVVSGVFAVDAVGESLIDMPNGWNSVAFLAVHFDGTAPVEVTKSVSYEMTNGDSRLILHGSFPSSDSFQLDVAGSAFVAQTAVPFGGYFQSVGYVVGGQPLRSPKFQMIGDLASVPGGVDVGQGSHITAGQFGFTQNTPDLSPASEQRSDLGTASVSARSISPQANAPTSSGTFYFTLSTNNSWTLKTTVNYTDQNNWTATVVTTATDTWVVSGPAWIAPGVNTLSIAPNKFSGTITDSKSTVSWNVSIAEVTWQNTGTNMSLVSTFSLSNECPLEDECPDATGIFFGLTDGSATFPSPIPHMAVDGSFLTDGTWWRFDAFPDDVTFNGIAMHDTSFSMWKGQRDDSFSEDLVMPDLSAQNGGFQVEFCGYFTVAIPNITTVTSGGCAEWTQVGLVMAQIAPGGNVTSGASSGGVTIGNTTIDGWAWSDLSFDPKVIMNGVELALDQNINEMTGTMHIPANLMKATGNANVDASITATGWYSSGDFSLDALIPVNLKNGGFTIEDVSVHIGKDGSHFSLELGADATVSMGGNHFPVTALIAVGVGGGSNEITVSVSAKGTTSTDPNGGFDMASLLPSGTFEPAFTSTVDGSFDAKQGKAINDDPGFEKATGSVNLMSNADFETGASQSVFTNGDFESGNTGNVLVNGDGETTEQLTNGDFETNDATGWGATTGYAWSFVSGTAPSNDQGAYYLSLKNSSSTIQGTSTGFYQQLPIAPVSGAKYHISAWVKSSDSSNKSIGLLARQGGTASGCANQSDSDTSQSFTATPTWQQVSMDVTGVSCRSAFTLYMSVPTAGQTVYFDAVSVTITGASTAITMPIATYPSMWDGMNSTSGRSIYTSGSSTVSVKTDATYDLAGDGTGSIETWGTNASWMYSGTGAGYVSGDFNMSYDLYWPASSSRDIASFGFWLSGTVGSQTGYGLRLQSATGNNNDSGFFTISNGTESSHQGGNYGALSRSTWYRVNLSASGSTVTATVTKISDGTQWASWSTTLPSGNRAGVFGENKPGTSTSSSSEGHRIDNIILNYGSNTNQYPAATGARYVVDPSNAHSGVGYMAINSQPVDWMNQWSTGEVPNVGDSYSLTAWVRSRSGTINGTLGLMTAGGTTEASTYAFTATSTWQKITVTVPMVQSGHTDILWYLRGLSNSEAELDLDDVVLQSGGGWSAGGGSSNSAIEYPKYNAGSNTDAAHAGVGSLLLTDRNNGSWFTLNGIPPRSGATYTTKFWVRSESGTATGQYQVSTLDGSGSQTQVVNQNFSISTTWQQITLTMTVNNSGQIYYRLQFQVTGNTAIRVDDITTTVAGADIPQEVDTNWGPQTTYTDFTTMPANISKTSGVYQVTDFANGGTSLRSNGGFNGFQFPSGSFAYTTSDFDMSVDVYFAASSDRDIADVGFWMTGSVTSQTGYAFRLDTSDSTGNFGWVKSTNGSLSWFDSSKLWGTVNRSTWYRVKLHSAGSVVTVEVDDLTNGSVIGTQTVTVPSGNRSGSLGQMRDGTGSNEGSRWDNLQVFRGSSVTANQKVILDSSKAHGGVASLQVAAPSGSTASANRSIPMSVTSGSTYTATAWVRSASGTVSGKMTLAGQSSNNVTFTATTTYQQVSVSTLMGSGTSNALTLSFEDNTSNSTLIVDDVSVQLQGLSQQVPWTPAPNTGGAVSQTVWADATKAHSGNNYMEVQPKFIDANFYKETPITVTAGDVYTASFWVKTKDGSSQYGSFALYQSMWNTNGRWVEFTANGTWQQVFITLPVSTSSPAVLDTNFYLPNGSVPLLIDDVEIRKVSTWGLWEPSGTTAAMYVNQNNDPNHSSAKGAGFANLWTTGGGAGITSWQSATVVPGSGFSIEAYVRSASGSSGTLNLIATTNTTSQYATVHFTGTGDWQYLTVDLDPNGTYTGLRASVLLDGAGRIDVDEIKVMPKVVVQSDPWTTSVGSGGSVSAVVYSDSTNAHDSLGVMRVSKTGSNDSAVQHSISTAPAAGSKYVLTAWVRSVSSASMNGQFTLYAQGGTQEYVSQGFATTTDWQMVTLTLPVNNGGHTSMLAQMVMRSAGVEIWMDDVVVQPATWLPGSNSGATVTARQMNDASSAQSGSGYESISKSGSPDGWISYTSAGAITNGTTQTVQAYVRSADGSNVSGRLMANVSGGTGTDTGTTSFTATSSWKQVAVNVPITATGRNNLQIKVYVDSQNKWLDLDSVTFGQSPLGNPDGVSTSLDHPDHGYVYLWDDAFGVPGAHLWALTAQIQIMNGRPGIGVGGTLYFDPSKMSGVMTGTDWLRSNMDLNISRADPCLAFGFDATGLNSGVSLNGGVFTTKKFQISMAPKGCQIGDDVVPAGEAFSFDAQFGDGTVHIDLSITRDANNLPQFNADMGLTNIKLGGFIFNAMELKIAISTSSTYTHLMGDFETPLGQFYADYTLTAKTQPTAGFTMDANVSVSNWALKSADFSVSSFTYHQTMDVYAGQCSSFQAGTSGNMTMKSKNYQFSGHLNMNCHGLQVFDFTYQYSKSSVLYSMYISYDSSTRIIAGGLEFDFDKKMSWKYVGIKHTRHPQFAIKLDFSMPIDNPSAGHLSLYGKISVSGGNGTVSCNFGSPGDDGCSLHVHVNVFGGQTLDATW